MLSLLLLAAAAPPAAVADLLPRDKDGPGCVVEARQAGRVIAAEATGLANLEDGAANTADTVFEIGSVSKQFIGAGVALLAEEGRLRLEDPITRWLPELPPLYRGVTVDMLVHHTSGIRSWNNLAELTGRGEDSTGYDNAWVLQAVARQRRLNHAPGAEYLYSNSNFVLAAIIIERASGRRLNDFYRDRLFARLGMTHTRWRTDFREIVPGRAQAYGPGEGGGWRLDMPLNDVAGAGGLLSTVGDLQRWAAALADPAPADRGWVARLVRPGALSDGTPLRYGMGIETAPVAGQAALSHAGATGSYRAWLGIFPAQKLAVALLCNSGAVNTEDLGPEVAARLLPQPAPTSPAAAVATGPAPADLAGLYRNLANDAAVEAKVDRAGLHLNGGAGFGALAADRLATADGGRRITVQRGQGGGVLRLVVTRVANTPVLLQPVTPWKPTAAELRRLVGSYRSAEVDGVQRIEVAAGALVWRDPSGDAHPLSPTYRNAFEAPDVSWTLRFQPAPHGRVGLEMSITRARRIAFARSATPPSRAPSR